VTAIYCHVLSASEKYETQSSIAFALGAFIETGVGTTLGKMEAKDELPNPKFETRNPKLDRFGVAF
jgi:hypothetical protein